MYSQGDVLWIDLNPTKGNEEGKKRPCIVVSNNHYQDFFNTVIVIPISSSEKYRKEKRYTKSMFFVLQHLRTIDPHIRAQKSPIDHLDKITMSKITNVVKHFW